MNIEIDKRKLWRYVNIKIKRIIHHYHVAAIISILFEEILSDLKQEKQLKIANLGTLSLEKTKPRKYHDVRFNKVLESKGGKIMKFSLAGKLRKKIIGHLDLDKTLKDD